MEKVIPNTPDELNQHLQDQLQLLKININSYDNGNIVVYKTIASIIRVLVHDTDKSVSLLKQLNSKDHNFYDTVGGEDEFLGSTSKRIGSYHALVGAGVGSKSGYVPYLDDSPPGNARYAPFDEYWNRIIFIDGKGNEFKRRDIILSVANKDGGNHIDPDGLKESYAELSKSNSLGISAGLNEHLESLQDPVPATVRQVGHEILRTLDKRYPIQKMKIDGKLAILGGLSLFKDANQFKTKKKVGRNDPCACGTLKDDEKPIKFKKCHGK